MDTTRTADAYGHTTHVDMTLRSLHYADADIRAAVTPTQDGLVFVFDDDALGLYGQITVLTDGDRIVSMKIGGVDDGNGDTFDVGDWGFGVTIDFRAPTATIAGDGVDFQTADTLSSLLHTVAAYTQGRIARITGRLPA
jgi:hypothetical protein